MSSHKILLQTRKGPVTLFARNKPYAKQEECLRYQYGEEFFAELMDPGTGKTYVAIVEAANLYLEGKIDFVFVVAPSGVDDQWAVTEIPKHCPEEVPFETYVWDGLNTELQKSKFKKFYNTPGKLKFFCVKIDAFSRTTYIKLFKNIILGKKAYLAIDEASRIKNMSAERTFNLVYMINVALNLAGQELDLQGANRKGQRGRMTKIESFVMVAKYRRVLTGSLVTTSPFNIFAPFNFLKYNFFNTSYEGFRARHGIEIREKGYHDVEYKRFIRRDEMERVESLAKLNQTPEEISNTMKISESSVNWILEHPGNYSPYKNLEKLKADIAPYSFRCRLEDVIDLELVEQRIEVDMSPKQRKVYRELAETMMAQLEDRNLLLTSKLALIVRLAQITSGFFPADILEVNEEGDIIGKETELIPIEKTPVKLEVTIDELHEHNFETPLLLFARFRADIELLETRLKEEFPLLMIRSYYGATPELLRNRYKKEFEDGFVDILIANPALAGIGLNLQRSSKTINYSSSPSYEQRTQLIGRTKRAEQKSNLVLVKDILCRKSIDFRIMEILKQRETLANYFSNRSVREVIGV